MPCILFIHENFPAQFGGVADYLADKGWDVVFATAASRFKKGSPTSKLPSGVKIARYTRRRDAHSDAHPYLCGTEQAVLNGQGFARCAVSLRDAGFQPDIIVAHSGWGSGCFAKAVWPRVKFVQYLEWWYNYPPVDNPSWTSARSIEDRFALTLCRNLPFLMDIQTADSILIPTEFQQQQLPDWARVRSVVMHDGVDTCKFRSLGEGETPFHHDGLPDEAPIVTYATRGMEPMRGFPEFMRAWAVVQRQYPEVHAVVAGTDTIHYGPRLPKGQTWKKKALAEAAFDMSRLHFVGRLPIERYRSLLRRSSAHVYLTRPFVLSWSLIEAMATACPLVVSNTEPIQEALTSEQMARFVDIGSTGEMASAIGWCLNNSVSAKEMGIHARNHVLNRYASSIIYPQKSLYFQELIGK